MDKHPTYEELLADNAALKSEVNQYKAMVDNSVDAIWKMDLKLRFTYISPSIYQIMGFKQEEWIGSKLSSHATFKEFVRMAKKALSVINSKDELQLFEAEMLHKNGTPVKLEIAGKLLYGKNGLPNELVGITRDISKRKQTERELQEKTRLLNESLALKDKFFSIVSHDLKSPFNSLIGYNNLLIREAGKNSNKKILNYAQQLNITLDNTFDYLNNLLEWSRIQTGNISFNPEKFNLHHLVLEVSQTLNLALKNKNIQLINEVPKDFSIHADKNIIGTVIINMVSNAIKFTLPGGFINVSGSLKSDLVFVQVLDNGVGIEKEILTNLFRIEHSVSTEGTNDEKGTGLGLILCKEFIKIHQGEIGVESTFGTGSRFWFTIPANLPNH